MGMGVSVDLLKTSSGLRRCCRQTAIREQPFSKTSKSTESRLNAVLYCTGTFVMTSGTDPSRSKTIAGKVILMKIAICEPSSGMLSVEVITRTESDAII